MLKLAPKTEYGQKTAPFSKVLFSVQTAVRPGNKPASANQVRAYSLLLSNDHHIWIGGPQTLKKLKLPQPKRKDADRTPQHHFSAAKLAYMAFLCVTMSLVFCQPAFAATDVWSKAKEIMQDVYTQILAISTIAAIVTASVALLLMNFSRSGRTVDESRAWLKRICITWAVLNGLGFIMAYVTPLFSGGQWTG